MNAAIPPGLIRSILACVLLSAFSSAQVPAVRRLDLSGGPVLEARQVREGARLEWTDLAAEGATEDWVPTGAKLAVLPNGPQKVRAILHPVPGKVAIPAEMEFRDTPQLTLELIVRGEPLEMRAQLMHKGKVRRSQQFRLEPATETQEVLLKFDPVPAGSLLCDRVALLLPAGDYPVGIVSARLEDATLGGSIPAEAYGGFAMVRLGGEARPGTVLSSEGGQSCTFRVEDAEERLVFSYAAPKSVLIPGSPAQLAVELTAEGLESAQFLHPFMDPEEDSPTWREAELPLAQYQGREVTATFRIVAEGDGEHLAVVGVPRVFLPRANPGTVLLITVDGHRRDHLAFRGIDGRLSTPTLSALAGEGMRFDDAIAPSNESVRSHRALFAGSLADSADAADLAQLFANLGYSTLACLSSGDLAGISPGFDRVSSPESDGRRPARKTIRELLGWTPEHEGAPVFAWVQLAELRAPYEVPDDVLDRHYPDDIDPFDVTSPVSAFEFAPSWNPLIGDPFYTEALYDGAIAHLDNQLAELIDSARFRDAVIAYVGSHGQNLRKGGDHRFGHGNLSPATLSVPLILKGPGAYPGVQHAALRSTLRLGKTLLDMAGHDDADFPGKSLLQDMMPQDEAYPAIRGDGGEAAWVDKTWLLRLELGAAAGEAPAATGLFRRASDPPGQRDLSATQGDVVQSLRQQLIERLAELAGS